MMALQSIRTMFSTKLYCTAQCNLIESVGQQKTTQLSTSQMERLYGFLNRFNHRPSCHQELG